MLPPHPHQPHPFWPPLSPPHTHTQARRLLTDPAPELRASLEDLVLSSGRLRWGRLENLFAEGSKSQDYDPQQVCVQGGGV